VKYVFRLARFMAAHGRTPIKVALRLAALRELLLAVPVSVGSRRMSQDDAAGVMDDLAGAVAFEETFAHSRAPFVARDIDVPVTVAFGSMDMILTTSARRRSALPDHVRWLTMRGWGHVPMWADPAGVADLIIQAGATAGAGR